MAPGIPCAEVLSTTYFGHDALVALRLEADHTVVTSRVHGTAVPPTGSIVGLTVVGEARAFETHRARSAPAQLQARVQVQSPERR